ncbi:GNAT family N-acetyltransferase [Metabacillus niabensis]|uniref:GNAT family acetyltransferase n=1 Tax=Metabacillus niabensis TaxID=324854 RepID=A0ABT9Z0G7_9BACI|nr:GNAT family N-acetyltransferase [Metabacillus niabensis]MDQ0225692.1 putative GNAT family acetyltransferase [Metabacillus niabensis]
MRTIEMVQIVEENMAEAGCYCLRSKPNSTGYINKNKWLVERFNEGLKYVKIMENNKPAGFIEYAPIEYCSRAVYGENYLVIHCLWVNITGKGYATKLIEQCIQEAKERNKAGVIVVTNPDTSWTPSKEIFMKNNFIKVDEAPYGFELLVYKLKHAVSPYFPNNWDERLESFNDLTIVRTPQCPFIDISTDNIVKAANHLGISLEIIDLKTREELLRISPTPYGVYGVIYKNKLISFHRLTVHSAMKRLKELV